MLLINREPKVFSGITDLPKGRSSTAVTPGCIVLEGGAFRGCYTSGVLDTLMENDLNFQTTIGVSAGALNGLNYVAGQIGRSARVNLGFRHDSRYVGTTAMLNNLGIIGFDFLFGDYNELDPLDEARFYDKSRDFYAVATDAHSGKTAYFNRDTCNITQAIRASASMPYVSMPVHIAGKEYLDGGCSCSVPVDWALRKGFEKIVVVRTHPVSHFFKPYSQRMEHLVDEFYRNRPDFAAALTSAYDRYNKMNQALIKLHNAGRIYMIAPKDDLDISRLESDMEKLGSVYYLGYEDMKDRLPSLKQYLNS